MLVNSKFCVTGVFAAFSIYMSDLYTRSRIRKLYIYVGRMLIGIFQTRKSKRKIKHDD